jgi:hypothetical protein
VANCGWPVGGGTETVQLPLTGWLVVVALKKWPVVAALKQPRHSSVLLFSLHLGWQRAVVLLVGLVKAFDPVGLVVMMHLWLLASWCMHSDQVVICGIHD